MTTTDADLAADIDATCRLTGEFTLRSGQVSTEYFDKYLFEADPLLLARVAREMAQLLPADTDLLGGLEMGGIPIATTISQLVGTPALFIRKKAKEYGTAKLAEGPAYAGKRVTLIEDVITTGGAVRDATNALREAGAIVEHVFVNFYYDIYPESKKTFADLGVRLHYLATWWDVLAVVKKGGYLQAAQIAEVEKFLHEPAKWSVAHGGVSSLKSGS